MNPIANLPIFRRLFLAFFLATLIPDLVIVVMTTFFIHTLNAEGVGSAQTNPIIIGAIAALLLSTVVVIAIGYLVNLTITRPLRHLSLLTKRISKGDTSARATITTQDEIFMVASSMNNMLDNIVHLIQQAQNQRDNLQSQVEKLVSEVSGVGEGDLRVQAEVSADALGVLADSFNYMVEELSSLVVRVKLVAQEVENSTTLTFDRMAQLVEIADQQIQHIALAGEEIERMASSSRQVAERAQALFAVAREAGQTVEEGRSAVQQTIEGMGRIDVNVKDTAGKVQLLGERSREIKSVIDVISTLAHQTNRLALDAAIQAAMAGQNGKGFGAVAADIRRLAERAKEQATSINRIVGRVLDDIGAVAVSMQDTERETQMGAKLATETARSLESLFSVVERQAQEIETINQMARQQLTSSGTVVGIMEGVSNATQQSADSTRNVSQEMERLARLAERLLASVEAFKLRDDAYAYFGQSSRTSYVEEPVENGLTVSGVFRTVSGDVPQTPFANAGQFRQALPAGNSPWNGTGKGSAEPHVTGAAGDTMPPGHPAVPR